MTKADDAPETEATVDELAYRMWMSLGMACSDWVVGMTEDLSELKWVDEAIARAERAETCLRRADAIRARSVTLDPKGGEG